MNGGLRQLRHGILRDLGLREAWESYCKLFLVGFIVSPVKVDLGNLELYLGFLVGVDST